MSQPASPYELEPLPEAEADLAIGRFAAGLIAHGVTEGEGQLTVRLSDGTVTTVSYTMYIYGTGESLPDPGDGESTPD